MFFETLAVIGLVCLFGIHPAIAQDGTDEQGWDPQAFDIAFAPFAQGSSGRSFWPIPMTAADACSSSSRQD